MENNRFDPLGTLKEILLFIAVSVILYGWAFLMLLIISFVLVSVVRIKIELMLVIAGVFAIVGDAVYVIRRLAKKRKEREIQERLKG